MSAFQMDRITVTRPDVEPLRRSQVEAKMVQDPDPRKHLAIDADGEPLPGREPCTMLPPAPRGAVFKRYICAMKPGGPLSATTLLGVDFLLRKYDIVSRGDGAPPEHVPIPNVVELADNQLEALRLAASVKRVSGYVETGVERNRGGQVVPTYEYRPKMQLSEWLDIRPADFMGTAEDIAALRADNERLRAEAVELHRAAAEVKAARDRVKAAVPNPKA